MIYRTSALQFAVAHAPGAVVSHAALCALWKESNFPCIGDRDPEHPLCEIERIYGGTYPFPRPVEKANWFRRTFGG